MPKAASCRCEPSLERGVTRLSGERNGALKVAVTAPPDKGKANEAVREVLCAALGLKRSEVELIAGHASRGKKFLVRGLKPDALAARLDKALA